MRLIAVGRNKNEKKIHVVFTMRKGKIRIISARRMHKKEVTRYEKIKENSAF